jgi:hypothetical protein
MAEGSAVVPQPPLQSIVAIEAGADMLSGRQALGMLLQPLDTEQLRTDRLVIAVTRR